MIIGEKIKDAVYKKGFSVIDFAKLINKSRNYIYAIYEKDSIDTGLLAEISKVLDLPITYFFEDEIVNQNTNGNSNIVVGRDNNGHINMDECQDKLADAILEIEHLKTIIEHKEKLIEEKERLINVLLNK